MTLNKNNCENKEIECIMTKSTTSPNRCLTCRKKVGIYGFTCKCENYYCTKHRYPESHDCTFNYKEEGRTKIRKENPIIINSKIQRI